MGGPGETKAACARGLAQLLAFGEALDGRPLDSLGELCAGDPEALSVLVARSRRGQEAAAARGASREETARRTVAACGLAARWQAALGERGIRTLPLGGVAHVGRLYGDPGERLVERAQLLVSPYDAARARLVLATGGLERAGEPMPHGTTFLSGGPPLELRWAFHPPGWSSLPTSPFFRNTLGGEPPCPPEIMGPAASWAVHRLIVASTLWRPAAWRPLELAESAALGTLVPEDQRYRWGAMVHRWGAGRLWHRADELDGWLLGGRRPVWLAETLAHFELESPPWVVRPGLVEGLALQDTPARAVLFLLRWGLLRLRR